MQNQLKKYRIVFADPNAPPVEVTANDYMATRGSIAFYRDQELVFTANEQRIRYIELVEPEPDTEAVTP